MANRVECSRPELDKLMASLKRGDIVVVTKLDRLGRSTRDLFDPIDQIINGPVQADVDAILADGPQSDGLDSSYPQEPA